MKLNWLKLLGVLTLLACNISTPYFSVWYKPYLYNLPTCFNYYGATILQFEVVRWNIPLLTPALASHELVLYCNSLSIEDVPLP